MSRRFEKHYAGQGILAKRNVGILFEEGGTIPADGTVGYAPGCIFIDTDATAPLQVWVNDGTFASSLFKQLAARSGIVTAITTLTVTRALHDGKTILLSLLAGFATTLPAATGSGMKVTFRVGIVNTSNSYTIATSPTTDIFAGQAFINDIAATPDLVTPFATASNSNVITLNGTTTGGGLIGDWVELEDIKSGVWGVSSVLYSPSGGAATPFSHV